MALAWSLSHGPGAGSLRSSQCVGRMPMGRLHEASCSRKWNIDTCLAYGLRTRAKVKASRQADSPSTRRCNDAEAWKKREPSERSLRTAVGELASSSD